MALAGRGESTYNLFLLCAHGVEATWLPEPWSVLTATPEISGMRLRHRQSRAPGPPSLGLRGRKKQRDKCERPCRPASRLPLGDAVSVQEPRSWLHCWGPWASPSGVPQAPRAAGAVTAHQLWGHHIPTCLRERRERSPSEVQAEDRWGPPCADPGVPGLGRQPAAPRVPLLSFPALSMPEPSRFSWPHWHVYVSSSLGSVASRTPGTLSDVLSPPCPEQCLTHGGRWVNAVE